MRISLGFAFLSLFVAASLRADERGAWSQQADGLGETPVKRHGALVRLPAVDKGSTQPNPPTAPRTARIPDSLLRTLTGRPKVESEKTCDDPRPTLYLPNEPSSGLGRFEAGTGAVIQLVQGVEDIRGVGGAPVVSSPNELPQRSFQDSVPIPVQVPSTDLKKIMDGLLFQGGAAGASVDEPAELVSDAESIQSANAGNPLSSVSGENALDRGGLGSQEAGLPAERTQPAAMDGAAGQLYWNPKAGPGEVALHADRAPLSDILRLIADRHQMNLVIGPGVQGEITLALRDVHLEEALDAIAGVTGHTWFKRGNLLYVTSLAEGGISNSVVQGRMVRVFPLNYITAVDAQTVATGLLSPVGQVFIAESENQNSQKTKDTLVVDDVPAGIERVAMYLAEVDQAPRQVLIETHIFQVVLDESNRHGVNLRPVARLGSGSVTLETLGFANEGTAQGMKVTLDSTDFSSVIELIQTNTNSRTLASPKILATDRQESNIQIGKRLSYLTTTTTQTASTQTVQFLDTGVVLTVKPIISADNQILMSIAPKVSGGQLNAETNLPEEESTELKTTVLLPDGGGVIIGGLIKDEAIDNEARVPGFSRIPGLGWFFRKHEAGVIKTEIIVALVAKIQDELEMARPHEHQELGKAVPPYAATELVRPSFAPIQMAH